jgi:hypothetical protein
LYLNTSYVLSDDKNVVKSDTRYRDIPDDVLTLIFSLVELMCNADPFSRLSLNDAKMSFEIIIPILKAAIN